MAKEKNCPKCGVLHTKRGPYCSQSCGNSRKWNEEYREHFRSKLKEYHASPEGIATQKISSGIMRNRHAAEAAEKAGEFSLTDPDWMLDIPLTTDNLDADDESFDWR